MLFYAFYLIASGFINYKYRSFNSEWMDKLNLTLIGMGIATGLIIYWENWTHGIILLLIYPLVGFCIQILK